MLASILAADSATVWYALLGGVLPALLWLWFWLREDEEHPEPRGMIIAAFLAGTLAVFLAYPLERFAYTLFGLVPTVELLLVWAATEEILKFLAVYFIAIRSHHYDEPIDAVLYLTTAALGFAALENTLFLLSPLAEGQFVAGALTGSLRFIGATVLHVVASAVVGLSIGSVFYRSFPTRAIAAGTGLVLAISLHTLFNFFIIADDGAHTETVFVSLWAGALLVMLLCEYVKRIKPPRISERSRFI